MIIAEFHYNYACHSIVVWSRYFTTDQHEPFAICIPQQQNHICLIQSLCLNVLTITAFKVFFDLKNKLFFPFLKKFYILDVISFCAQQSLSVLRYVENIIKPSLSAWDLTTANLKRLIGENWIINMGENILLYVLDIVL